MLDQYKLFFFNDTGILLGRLEMEGNLHSMVLKTFDGGQSWSAINYPIGFPEIAGFINIFALNSKVVFASSNSYLFMSIDGCNSWNQIDSILIGGGSPIGNLYFIDMNTGFFTKGDRIFKTIDGGQNWIQVYNGGTLAGIDNIQFTSQVIGYAAGGAFWDNNNFGIMSKTEDGGDTWTNIDINFGCVTDFNFIDSQRGYIFTIDGKLLKTIDGGEHWTLVSKNLDSANYPHSYFISEFEGFYCNRNHIYITANGGRNWKIEFVGDIDSTIFNGILFVDKENGFAFSSNGAIYKKAINN